MDQADVVIAGAGPVGTIAAYKLASDGFRVILCEANSNCAEDLRASTFHPPTVEMLDELGLADEIIARGLKAPIYHFRERSSGETVEFDLGELADEVKFPFRVQCEQHVMANLVADRLRDHPSVDLRFDSRVVHFTQNDAGVTVNIETSTEMQAVQAKYLIAADGGNSIIRKWLGVEFEGFTYPERFLCLSTKRDLAEDIDGLAYVNYVSDPEEWLVLLRVPSVWRILVPAFEQQSDEYLLSDEKKDKVMHGLVGNGQVATEHRTIYRVHQRVVKQFNHGRVLLIGDAAHLNNPLGGFGMNSGIHDAWNLCDKLTKCLRGEHDESLLGLFNRQRKSATHNFIQAQTIQNKNLLEHSDGENHQQRLAEMRKIQASQSSRRGFLLKQAMYTSLAEAALVD